MNEEDFKTTKGFKSYVNKPEITELDPSFLVAQSKNVLIDYASRVVSRNGYTLFGPTNTGAGGIKSSYEWQTSTGKEFSMRVYDGRIEYYWNSTYNLLKSGYATSYFQFAKIWDNTEKLDMLLWVLGDTNTYKWSGGVTKARSNTPSTLMKQGVITSATTIAFVAGTPGTVAPTITDSANNFINAGFVAGNTLYVTGSSGNSRNFTIGSVTAGTITLVMTDTLVSEIAGPSITIHTGEPTWASSRFMVTYGVPTIVWNGNIYTYTGGAGTDTLTGVSLVTPTTMGVVTMTIASPCVVSYTAHGLVAGDSVQFTTTGALPTGLTAGTTYYVIAAGLTANAFEVSTTVGGSAVNTSGTQSGVHTLLKSSLGTVALGDTVFQSVIVLANPGAIPAGFKQDLIGVQINQLILGSTKSQEIYISKNTDYTNFTLTSPRVPGDPAKVTMDNYCTCIIPTDNPAQTKSSLIFGGGTNEFFTLLYQMSQDNSNELVDMIKMKTASSSGLISRDAICTIKNATAYITREPSLDTLGTVESQDGAKNVPLSDLIKNDFDKYGIAGFLNAHMKYFKRAIYIALPALGYVLIYDLQRKLWQPPQTMSVGRFAIIGDELYGHSFITNESYKLFVGTDDNGIFIPQVARFAYNNGGRRDQLKNLSEYWTDGYITGNGNLNAKLYFGYDGIAGLRTFSISGADSSITNAQSGSSLGQEPFGSVPLGGAISGIPSGLVTAQNVTMLRFWQINTLSSPDYMEHFVEYSMNTLGGQFAIVAHGSNQWNAGTVPVSHKK